MGCVFSRRKRNKNETSAAGSDQPTQYSWDQRPKEDISDLIVQGLTGQSKTHRPGVLHGRPFCVQACCDSDIVVLDHSAAVSVDDCTKCRITLGPVSGSVFLRNCKDCTVLVACQQFRARDCSKLLVLLYCASQPIIEACAGIKFACYQCYYPELASQFQAAGLDVFNNDWSNVHDFTPIVGEQNWTILTSLVAGSHPIAYNPSQPASCDETWIKPLISIDQQRSIVPTTLGRAYRPIGPICVVVVLGGADADNPVRTFINEMVRWGNILVQMKHAPLRDSHACRLFENRPSYLMDTWRDSSFSLEFNGEKAVESAKELAESLFKNFTIYISRDPATGSEDEEIFFNDMDLHLSA
uniref:protein XRP2 n=1 Tax=Myxine glutinosa TaxID=7769 RepID=UPI00358FC5FB